MTSAAALGQALRSAWGLNRHSVVEVMTSRAANVDHHKQIQAAVARAAQHAYAACTALPGSIGAGAAQWPALVPELKVASFQVAPYELPLRQAVTTDAADRTRRGLLLRVVLRDGSGRCCAGVGEAAPLPGLHSESLQEAESQLRLLAQLLQVRRAHVVLVTPMHGSNAGQHIL